MLSRQVRQTKTVNVSHFEGEKKTSLWTLAAVSSHSMTTEQTITICKRVSLQLVVNMKFEDDGIFNCCSNTYGMTYCGPVSDTLMKDKAVRTKQVT